MRLDWKEFKINLNKFNAYLKANVSEIDGIATYEDYFELVEIAELSIEKQQLIQNYYDNLDEAVEAASLIVIPDVTPRQIRQALIMKGVYPSQIDTAIASLPEPNRSIAQVEWDHSITFQRNRPLVTAVGAMLGWTSQQLDDLWIIAGNL